jgi:hypothetical protein
MVNEPLIKSDEGFIINATASGNKINLSMGSQTIGSYSTTAAEGNDAWHDIYINVTSQSSCKVWVDYSYVGVFSYPGNAMTDTLRFGHTSSALTAMVEAVDDFTLGYNLGDPSMPAEHWAPHFTSSTPPASGTMGVSYSYHATTNESCTFSMDSKPSWATLTSSTVSGTPNATGSASFHMKAVSTNGTLPAWDNWSVTISAAASHWAPHFLNSPNTSATVGIGYVYHPLLNETSTLTLSSYANWSSSSLTGGVHGTPTYRGNYSFNLRAVSANGTGSVWLNWTVHVTRSGVREYWAPTFENSPVLTGQVGVMWSYEPDLNESSSLNLTSYANWSGVSNGFILGIPTAAGNYSFNLKATSTPGLGSVWLNWTVAISPAAVHNDTGNQTGNTTLGLDLPAGWYIYLAGVSLVGAVIWGIVRRPLGLVVWVIILIVALAWWYLVHDFAIPAGFLGGLL